MRINHIIVALMITFLFGCASGVMGNLEAARFALDKGEYTTAITKANSALEADPGNVEATRILASAYFARSGLDYFDIAEGIMDLQDSDTPNFQQIADVLPETGDISDLRSAIAALADLSGITASSFDDDGLADAAFDLGLMQIIEHFAIGVYQSDYYDALDVSGITDTNKTNVQTDLLGFDNRLIAAGVDASEDWIQEIRQTYCILEPVSAADGFTTAEYQAFVGCQLSDDPDNFDTATLTAAIANCNALNPDNQDAAVEACYQEDTSL